MKEDLYKNPFPMDKDRYQIWEMLVKRDVIAFCSADWEMVQGDFIEENFMGIDARGMDNPDSWRMSFPSLKEYKTVWLEQAADFAKTELVGDSEQVIYDVITLIDIEMKDKSALVHKKFDGIITKKNGNQEHLNWQTLYRCRRINGKWKIAGFTGYMPYPMGHSKSNEPIAD